MIEKWLLKLARWIAKHYGYTLAKPEPIPYVAVEVVADVEARFAGASGEAKRHQALALLIKKGMTERQAAKAIEQAVEAIL